MVAAAGTAQSRCSTCRAKSVWRLAWAKTKGARSDGNGVLILAVGCISRSQDIEGVGPLGEFAAACLPRVAQGQERISFAWDQQKSPAARRGRSSIAANGDSVDSLHRIARDFLEPIPRLPKPMPG